MAKKIAVDYTKGNPLILIHPSQVICETGENSRRYTGDDVGELAQSIKEIGQLQAVGISRTADNHSRTTANPSPTWRPSSAT